LAASRLSSRFAAQQFAKSAGGHGSQPFQREVSLLDTLHQPFGDVFSGFVITAVWQTLTDFFKHHVHIRGCSLVDLFHFDNWKVNEANLSV
jgi:hypothetical protein